MSDTDRVRAWRDRLKQAGRVPMTIWVTAETKARYEDLALMYHRSPSELVQQALDAYRPAQASVSDTAPDTEQLHTLLRAELAQLTSEVTATVTETVTETLMTQLAGLVQAAVSAGVSATETATETVTAPMATVPVSATDTLTDTATDTALQCDVPASVTATVTEPVTDTVPLQKRQRAPVSTAYDADAAVVRMQALQAQGLSLAQIAAQLTAEGIPTRHGQPWHKGTVGYLLQTHRR